MALKEENEKFKKEHKEIIQNLCTQVAENMHIKFWGNDVAKIWGCILVEESAAYCDECPVQNVCPNEFKSWSK